MPNKLFNFLALLKNQNRQDMPLINTKMVDLLLYPFILHENRFSLVKIMLVSSITNLGIINRRYFSHGIDCFTIDKY